MQGAILTQLCDPGQSVCHRILKTKGGAFLQEPEVVDADALVQRVTAAVNATIIKLLPKQHELDAALSWDQSVKLAADVCVSKPGVLVQALQRSASCGDLFEGIASIFIDTLLVHPSPLGPLPPLNQWPAPCLITWEVPGADYIPPPMRGSRLHDYLEEVNDEVYLQEQLNGWLRYWKPDFPRFMWSFIRSSLAAQKKSMYNLGVGFSLEHTAFQKLQQAQEACIRRKAFLGNFTDATLQSLESYLLEKEREYEDMLFDNRGLLDWYRSTSFVLTGHTASTTFMGDYQYSAVRTLEASIFGRDCLEKLQEDTSSFFASIGSTVGETMVLPAWGLLMAWVEKGGLQEWLPQVSLAQ